MSLEAGRKFGPYEIIEQAGSGGMGEVYKAKDSRLDRIVAIKILPANIAGMDDFKQRFEREAKSISSLNHPNICTLYDIGKEDGFDYLVMEFLEGETLGERLSRGQIPYEETLQVGTQIASALESAHSQGMIHRDLKPGNIMLTKEGAKLMDFGLAKYIANASVPEELTEAITKATPLTGVGTILGTMQDMAPEQLEGKEADARSDIFAFGAVLYEMTTGKRAFEGTSQATLIAAIIERDPISISVVIPSTPPLFERLVKKCLSKDPQKRWQSATDLTDELRWISQAGSQVGLPLHLSKRRKVKFTIARVVGAIFITISLALAYMLFMQPKTEIFTNRFIISPSAEVDEIRLVSWSRISPDGRLIAFRAFDADGVNMLWIRPLNSLEPYPLRGTENIGRQFWSPDSKQIAFFKNNQLYKISVTGGTPQLICDTYGADGNWGSAGYILFDGNTTDTLKFVSASGGTPQIATPIDSSKGERYSAWPWFLSDGIHFIYTLYTNNGSQVRVGSIESDESTLLFNESQMKNIQSRIEYCKQGYLLFNRDNLLLAQEFDETNFKLIGDAKPIAQGIDLSGNASTFGTSDNGVLLYQYAATAAMSVLVWFDREGNELEKIGEPDSYRDIVLSPDNSKLLYGLYDNQGQNEDLWIRDFKRNLVSRLTFDKPHNVIPKWSPDGKYVIYSENFDGNFRTRYKRADGQGALKSLGLIDSVLNGPSHWYSDSLLILGTNNGNLDMGKFDFSDSSLTPILNSQFSEASAGVSKNGKYILYMSNESGQDEIYVKELDGDGGRWQISNNGGHSPNWSDDNKEIIYFTRFDLMAVDVSITDNSFNVGQSKKLFTKPLSFLGVFPSSRYTISNNGQRFLLNVPLNEKTKENIIVVQNWLEELKEK